MDMVLFVGVPPSVLSRGSAVSTKYGYTATVSVKSGGSVA
jgi:hypothetical protein